MNNDFFKPFTNRYSLSKTLRFELIPVGNTLNNIKNKGLLSKDNERAQNYKEVKKIIDRYHKYFIELALKEVRLTLLNRYHEMYYQNKEERDEKDFKKLKDDLRKEVVSSFNKGGAKELFARLDKKELIKIDLINWVSGNPDEKELVEKFKDFTTYFGGFNENRKNMYSDKEQSTAIAYRIIHENLPKFVENIKIYQEIKTKCPDLDFSPVYAEMGVDMEGEMLDDIFTIDYFNHLLWQSGIDFINNIIGGKTIEGGNKIKGLNEYINLYNQTQKEKSKRAPKFKQLYKQILSDRTSISFLLENYENDSELLNGIDNFYKTQLLDFTDEDKIDSINILTKTKELLSLLKEFNTAQVYLRNDTGLTNISAGIFGQWGVMKDALSYYYDNFIDTDFEKKYQKASSEKSRDNLEKIKEKWNKDYISIAVVQTALDKYIPTLEEGNEVTKKYSATVIADYFSTHFTSKLTDDTEVDMLYNITEKYKAISGLLGIEREEGSKNLFKEQVSVEKIKFFLDALLELLRFVKPLHLPDESGMEKDNSFYTDFEMYYKQLNLLTKLYDKVRNYLTQKPYSTDKIKLNFENKSNFLGGWVDSNTENSDNGTQSGGYLFRKLNEIGEYDYYLGISNDVKLFRTNLKDKIEENDKSEFERLDYYQLKTASIYGNSYIGSYSNDKERLIKVIYEFIESYNNKKIIDSINNYIEKQNGGNLVTPSGLINLMIKEDNNSVDNLIKYESFILENNLIIKRLKETLSTLIRVPRALEYAKKDYLLFTEVITDIEELSKVKVMSYFPVSQIEITEASNREKKPLYLFKITNKDLSFSEKFKDGKRTTRGKDNIHTLYFKQLMSGTQDIIDIGTGEIFFRKASINKDIIVHSAGCLIENKNPLKIKKSSVFDYDIIKDRRYTIDKFSFHLSTKLNYQQPDSPKYFNQKVNEHLLNNKDDVNIIGLDRGERNLIYLTLIDQKGNILLQESLNTLESVAAGVTKKTPYHTLLDNKEKERDAARKSWDTIENIKELKEGYISQVVHKIATMMLQHNAIVVMEDLNFGFKRGRFKVEKQVYQKLEKMLIDKLNYLVVKDSKPEETGGLFNALQLTDKVLAYKDVREQCGFLYYVPAWNTSKIDPVTGFVDFLKPKCESVHQSKEFFNKFESIKFNKEQDYFEFVFDYKNFTTKAEGSKTNWTVCTVGAERYCWNKQLNLNKGADEKINVTQKLKSLFEGEQWEYQNGYELKPLIVSNESKEFFIKLTKYLSITLSLRYSSSADNKDFILSPVANKEGKFYNSETADKTLPKDADANGAYHIALKGLWVLQQLSKQPDLSKLKLAISNKEWLQFVQEKKY